MLRFKNSTKVINGNLGALTVLEELASTTESETIPNILSCMLKYNLRGSKLWLEYKNGCNMEISLLKEKVLKGSLQ